jgi:hypothetical protein
MVVPEATRSVGIYCEEIRENNQSVWAESLHTEQILIRLNSALKSVL